MAYSRIRFEIQNSATMTLVQTYLRLFDEYRADGIVSARVTMCDLWAFEQYMLANLLREKDIPSLELEINYLMDSVGQVRTRVQAFVENLPRRSA